MSRAPLRFVFVLALLAALLGAARPAMSQGDERVVFAVIGDYGLAGPDEQAVATLVKGWQPDFIVTLGDNDYSSSPRGALDANVGQYYHEYIAPYHGQYGAGAAVNRFFPILGNHDWDKPDARPYLDFFTLPGNERYYDVTWGPVRLFALDSDTREPDGATMDSAQGRWLKGRLAESTACWNLVLAHHPPFSSGLHGPSLWMQWPFQAWGADAVLSGHDHDYERIVRDGFPYFVNGLGGGAPYSFLLPMRGSEVRHTVVHGAMRVTATRDSITYEFFTVDGTLIDSYTQHGRCAVTATVTPPTMPPTHTATATPSATTTTTPTPTATPAATATVTPSATPSPQPTTAAVQGLAPSPPPPAAALPLRVLEAIRTRLGDLRTVLQGWLPTR